MLPAMYSDDTEADVYFELVEQESSYYMDQSFDSDMDEALVTHEEQIDDIRSLSCRSAIMRQLFKNPIQKPVRVPYCNTISDHKQKIYNSIINPITSLLRQACSDQGKAEVDVASQDLLQLGRDWLLIDTSDDLIPVCWFDTVSDGAARFICDSYDGCDWGQVIAGLVAECKTEHSGCPPAYYQRIMHDMTYLSVTMRARSSTTRPRFDRGRTNRFTLSKIDHSVDRDFCLFRALIQAEVPLVLEGARSRPGQDEYKCNETHCIVCTLWNDVAAGNMDDLVPALRLSVYELHILEYDRNPCANRMWRQLMSFPRIGTNLIREKIRQTTITVVGAWVDQLTDIIKEFIPLSDLAKLSGSFLYCLPFRLRSK